MPTVIEATYQVTTPMFCGGANPADAELRIPSFKGALRFWWRALAWARLDGNLEEIKREEDELFGSADKGQSRVSMRLMCHKEPQTGAGHSLRAGPGAKYLGYGVMEQRPRERHCLEAPFNFKVRMRARDLDATQQSSLQDALTALGVFGGMGAKSRKGYGSLALQSLIVDGEKKWNAPRSTGALQSAIESLRVRNGSDTLPDYTAVSKETRCLLMTPRGRQRTSYGRRQSTQNSQQTPMALLNQIGDELKEAVTDVKGIQRIAFGLPRASRDASISGVDRRASPLFIHVRECGETPVAVLSFLPARFLDGDISGIPEEDKLYQPLHKFFNRLRKGTGQLDAVEVRL